MKFKNQAKTLEPTFQVLAHPGLENHPRDPDKKLRFCMAETLPHLGSPFGDYRVLFNPLCFHLLGYRPKSIDAARNYYSGKTEQVSTKCPETE